MKNRWYVFKCGRKGAALWRAQTCRGEHACHCIIKKSVSSLMHNLQGVFDPCDNTLPPLNVLLCIGLLGGLCSHCRHKYLLERTLPTNTPVYYLQLFRHVITREHRSHRFLLSCMLCHWRGLVVYLITTAPAVTNEIVCLQTMSIIISIRIASSLSGFNSNSYINI